MVYIHILFIARDMELFKVGDCLIEVTVDTGLTVHPNYKISGCCGYGCGRICLKSCIIYVNYVILPWGQLSPQDHHLMLKENMK